MKKKLLFLIIPLFFSSCSKWVVPNYTSVDKMINVEKGMDPQMVEETLGVQPYNILFKNDSIAIFEYNYRLKLREQNSFFQLKNSIHGKQSQKGGKSYFAEPSKFYILYQNNQFSTLVSTSSFVKSEYLLLKDKSLMLASHSDMITFGLGEDASYIHKIDRVHKEFLKKEKNNAFFFSPSLPYGFLGFKYAYLGNFGGYISASTDLGIIDDVFYLTVGATSKMSQKINLYYGAGFELGWGELILETGVIYKTKTMAYDFGFGLDIDDPSYSFLKIGIGKLF
ncbi:MAG: hypothetical protein U9R42_11715 [Bacteroidota bacterium]|nr:hypothetical protein [Bacteroidota bacterium]